MKFWKSIQGDTGKKSKGGRRIKMRELNIFEKIIYWLRSLFINKKKAKENNDKLKRQMCKKAVQSGVCTDYNCYACAWKPESEEI